MKTSQIALCLKYVGTPSKTPLISITSKSLGYQNLVGSENVNIIIPNVAFGMHDLTLQMINKNAQDTVVDQNGAIVQDLYAVIESLSVDQFDIIHKINDVSRYQDNDGNQTHTNGWITFSGPFEIWLQAPGWYFARNLSILPASAVSSYLCEHSIENTGAGDVAAAD